MKKLLVTLAVVTATHSFGQKTKWSFSILVAPGIGGPSKSIANTMKEQDFGETMNYDIFGLRGSIDYPKKESGAAFLLRAAFRQKANRSLFFVAGISNQGTVSGYHDEGSVDPVFGFSVGSFPRVQYKVWQFTGGYQFDLPHSCAKLGVGPSAFLFSYGLDYPSKQSKRISIVPGASLNARLPLGKQKRTFGLELVVEADLAPPAKMKEMKEYDTATPLKESHVNMIHGTAGILLTFRG